MSARILIADDERDTLHTLNLLLLSEGYSVMPCSDGLAALARAEEAWRTGEPYSLLVTDIHMPVMDGFDLMEEVYRRQIPMRCLGISGMGSKEMVLKLMRFGCLDFLDKPFNGSQLLETVRSVLLRPIMGDAGVETRLNAEIGRYRRDVGDLRQRIDSAQGEFQNLMSTDTAPLPLPLRTYSRPLNDMGGDLFFTHRTGSVIDMLVGDVAGHDQGASYMALLVKNFFEDACARCASGRDILRLVNEGVLRQNSQRLVTAIHIRLDLSSLEMEFHNAGHVPLVMIPAGKDSQPRVLQCPSVVLGLFVEPELAYERLVACQGDRFVFCSDGLYGLVRVDGASGESKEYGVQGLLETIAQVREGTCEEIGSAILRDALIFSRHKTNDDLLLGVFEIP
jgi:phosphoserine phosphatase RsbU/P